MAKSKEFSLSEEETLNLSQSLRELKGGDNIKIKFPFNGREDKLTGVVDVTQKKANTLFINIKETGGKHRNLQGTPYKFVLCLYNLFKASLLITDGGVHPVPFVLGN